jgi:hypothetical protein
MEVKMSRQKMSNGELNAVLWLIILGVGAYFLYHWWVESRADANFQKKYATIQADLGVACTGKGVATTANYDSETGHHTVMLFNSSGKFHEWSNNLPGEWLPSDTASTELVACIDNAVKVAYGILCQYSGGPPIVRAQYQQEIRLVIAQTGQVLASETLAGSPPPQCPQTAPVNKTTLEGDAIKVEQVIDWIQNHR